MSGSARIIGFANLSESQSFARAVRTGLETATAPYDDLDLVLRDNDFDNCAIYWSGICRTRISSSIA